MEATCIIRTGRAGAETRAWDPYTCPDHRYSTSEGRTEASSSIRVTYFLTRNPFLQKVGHSIIPHSSHSPTHQQRPQRAQHTYGSMNKDDTRLNAECSPLVFNLRIENAERKIHPTSASIHAARGIQTSTFLYFPVEHKPGIL